MQSKSSDKRLDEGLKVMLDEKLDKRLDEKQFVVQKRNLIRPIHRPTFCPLSSEVLPAPTPKTNDNRAEFLPAPGWHSINLKNKNEIKINGTEISTNQGKDSYCT